MNRLTRIAAAACLAWPVHGQAPCTLGVARDATGHPVEGAALRFYPAQSPARGSDSGAAHASTGRSRRDGRFRFDVTADRGCLVAEHRDAGSAIVWVEADVPRVVTLAPPATLRTSNGSSADWFVLYADDEGRRCRLPDANGPSIQLPFGQYQVLVRLDGSFALHDLELKPGSTRALSPPRSPSPRLETRGRALGRVAPLGFDDVELPIDGHSVAVPETDRIAEVVEDVRQGPCTARLVHWYDGRSELRRLSSPEVSFSKIALRGQLDDVEIESIDASGDAPEIRSRSGIDADSFAWFVPVQKPHQAFVRIRRPGTAPIVLRQPPPPELVVQFEPEARLSIRVLGADGVLESPAEVVVDQAPFGNLTTNRHTNQRGEAEFDGLSPGTTQLRVKHGSFRTAERRIELEPGHQRILIELEPGLTLEGTVAREGRPVPNAIVELRDPTDPESTRLVTSDARGVFRFRGLSDGSFTLFAWLDVGADTWSARISEVSPSESVRVVLELEDPPLPGRR
ncbi:MAG: carboxypeptidase regulatory-like domain-containing protein [Planctomycetes bacterium]|nr:carboxypeptidase regulatory-like domain-containing protein [Planctomycetota bacterium]